MNKPDTRELLLSTAESLILGKGFTAVGLAEILSVAGVPKGSFYHYFQSKEGFGVALLERFFAQYDERLLASLTGENALNSLLGYFQGWMPSDQQPSCAASRCLVVKLAGEVADLSEPMRLTLSAGMQRIVTRIAECLEQGKKQGSLAFEGHAQDCAAAIYSLWLGSALMSKVQHDMAPFAVAMRQTRQWLRAADE